jgi:secreted trypsin-like serine protease
MSRVTAALAVLVALILAFGAMDAEAIVGGDPAPAGTWPWMAALTDDPADAFYGQFCGATVIGAHRLLTAAHCVIGERASGMTVVVGRQRLTEQGGRELPVTGISVFRGYQGGSYGLDAAVVTVGRSLGVAPVTLAGGADIAGPTAGEAAWSVGWGRLTAKRTANGGSYSADRVRQLSQPVVSDDACEGAYGAGGSRLTYRPAWELCAGAGDASGGTCYGDSGGPLVVDRPAGWTQIGIVQSGDGCASAGFFDIYTRVDRIRAWALGARLTIQPEAITPTRIRGRFRVGQKLTCVRGRFAGSRASYAPAWLWVTADGEDIRAVGGSWHHRVTRADRRHRLTCDVVAHNAGGWFVQAAKPLDGQL